MGRWGYFYLIRLEFFGFRFHGWQKQQGLKTVQGMVEKTLEFVFNHQNFKTLGSGRTDAKVSADDFAFELFTNEPVNLNGFLKLFNKNLPPDIRAKLIEETNATFNIIKDSKLKEYHYFFNFGEKPHPFNAPFIHYAGDFLDVAKMQEAALIFNGPPNFKRYTSKPSSNTSFVREILSSKIEQNKKYTGQFTADNSYVFKIKSCGFLRYQVRMIMAALLKIGRGDWDMEDLKNSLENIEGSQLDEIAPPSGLTLHKVIFKKTSTLHKMNTGSL